MLVLAIWLFLAGYTIAITGKRNLGLSYAPQADGSIKAVDAKGNEAKAFSLMDVVQCGEASVSVRSQPAPVSASQSSRPAGTPLPAPNLNPLPVLNPAPVLQQVPNLRLPPIPSPVPAGFLGGLKDWERTISEDVYDSINRLIGGIRHVVSGIQLPRLQLPTPRPLL